MKRRLLVACAVLGFGIPGLARGGIEPSPFHLMIANRSDIVDVSSALHGQPMTGLVLYLEVEEGVSDTGTPLTRTIPIPLIGLAGAVGAGDGVVTAGETRVFSVKPGEHQISGNILRWRIGATWGVGPSPFNGYAFPQATSHAVEPDSPPALPATLLSPAFDLYAFASPGTLVGSVTMSNDEIYLNCPVVADPPWKNHGQYVRCVTHLVGDLTSLGVLTEDEADGVVSAAARSPVGK